MRAGIEHLADKYELSISAICAMAISELFRKEGLDLEKLNQLLDERTS